MCQYNELVRNHFAFLQKYGYTYSQENSENSVCFSGKNNRIAIIFSITEYELTCQFEDDAKNTFTLQDALEYMEMKEFKGLYQISGKEEIEKGILYLAAAVKTLFDQIDLSNTVNFQKIVHYRMDTHKQLLENYYGSIDIKRAEEYWKNREYAEAQRLYEKHINSLSKAQMKKLEICKEKATFL